MLGYTCLGYSHPFIIVPGYSVLGYWCVLEYRVHTEQHS